MAQFCEHCGTPLHMTDRFCPGCGQQVISESTRTSGSGIGAAGAGGAGAAAGKTGYQSTGGQKDWDAFRG